MFKFIDIILKFVYLLYILSSSKILIEVCFTDVFKLSDNNKLYCNRNIYNYITQELLKLYCNVYGKYAEALVLCLLLKLTAQIFVFIGRYAQVIVLCNQNISDYLNE